MKTPQRGGFPRVTVAGLSGDSGKTLVSLILLALSEKSGLPAAGFKKGPDFIDAAWLTWACGRPARNLDTFLMGFPACAGSFLRHALPRGLNVVEGNRGLFDGADAKGTHSTAELAKALNAPVLLVLSCSKMTRTVAALVLGCQRLDPQVALAGVVLNRVAGARHEKVLREAIDRECGVPVLGVLPRLSGEVLLPQRHLGLFTPEEHPEMRGLRRALVRIGRECLDWEGILGVARAATPLAPHRKSRQKARRASATIGFLSDSAFTFYYPENLEALEAQGARLAPLSPFSDAPFPKGLDALYIGGGFPETHGEALAKRRGWLGDLARAARGGLPIYAECGGLMLLSRAIRWKGGRHPMAGVLPFDVEVLDAPQGHGYAQIFVDRENPFFAAGTRLRGHEFHYSRVVVRGSELPETACSVERGTGALPGRDGILRYNTWASYTHLHAVSSPEWAPAVVSAARTFRASKKG